MAPRKSSISSGDSKAVSAPPLKQQKLTFGSAKRAASAGSLSKGKGAKSPSKPASPAISVVYSDSEDDARCADQARAGGGRRKRGASAGEPAPKRQRLRGKGENAVVELDLSDEEELQVLEEARPRPKEKERLDVQDKAGRWRKHYGVVREQMGNLKPVHAEGQTMVDHILRLFDLSYEYGPCIGVTRLQRWERAESLGLNPPAEVKEILLTKEGSDDDRYSQCVFYGEV